MATSESSLTDEKLRVIKDNFIIEQIQDYKSEDYSASDLSGCFGDAFKNWSEKDFGICSYNKLVQLRKVLRDHGVYVNTGRTKPEVIKALMDAVKKELPWPEQSQKPSAKVIGKRVAESSMSVAPRKLFNFQTKRRGEEEQIESANVTNSFNFQPQPSLFEPESSRSMLSRVQESSSSKPFSTGNTPQSNTLNLKMPYDRELGVFLRLYTNDDLKYNGQPNDSINFKYSIFLDNCTRASLPKAAYRVAIPTMFTGSALKRYFATCKNMLTHEEIFTSLRNYFENDEHHRNMLRRWNECSLNSFITKNPDKPMTEALRQLIEELSQLQYCLDDMYQGDKPLYNKLIEACRQNKACQLACFRPSANLQGLINDLYSSISTFEDTESSRERNNEVLVTDRKYYTSGQPYQRANYQRPQPTFAQKTRTPQQEYNKSRICYVCGAKGCWSSKHSDSERQQSKAKFLARLNRKVDQFFADTDADQNLTAYNIENLDKELETLVLETPLMPLHETTDDTDDNNPDHFITSIGAVSAESARNLVVNLQNCAFTHTISKELNSTEKDPSIYLTESRYSASEFHGIMIDTGASLISTAGYQQYLALNKNLKTNLIPPTTSTFNVQFGIGSTPSIGSINLHTPVGLVVFHIVKANIPFILCLKDMDSLGVYFNNVQNMLIQNEKYIPTVRKFGHAFLLLKNSNTPNIFLTENELRQLHRRFGHPSVNRLVRILQRSGHENNGDSHRSIVEQINKLCHYCQLHGKSPGKFKFTIKNDVSFNHTIVVDVMFIEGDPVLHIIDEATNFQAARWLPNMTALSTWNAIRQCWIDVYLGPPDMIIHDSGTNFTADEFQKSSTSMGIITKCAPVEAHHSIGLVERYHAPLRRAYNIIKDELKSDSQIIASKALILQMAVKAVNDTAGPDGLIPTLLVFGAFPKMSSMDPPAPNIITRAKAIKSAMNELSKIHASRQVKHALRLRNGPRTDTLHDTPIGSDVLVWRIHDKKWHGPYKLLNMDGENCTLELPKGPTIFRSTSVKRYFASSIKSLGNPNEEQLHNNISSQSSSNNQTTSNTENPRRNPTRERQLPFRFRGNLPSINNTIVLASDINADSKPSSFAQSRLKEIEGLINNGVFEIYNKALPPSTRIFKTRFIDQIKNEGTSEAFHKSRLVVQAYNDNNKQHVLTQAPTIQRASQRLILCLAMVIPNTKVALRDISQAYTQSKSVLSRDIFVKPVAEFGLPPNSILRVIRPLYGIAEAGTHWFDTYHKHHIERLNMKPSTFDQCLLYSKNLPKIDNSFGVIGLQTDDTLLVANQAFLDKEQKAINEAGLLHKPLKILDESQPLNFNGTICTKVNNSINISQKRQIDCIKLINTSLSPSTLKTYYIAQRARGAYIATISQPEASFALSQAAQITQPTALHATTLNKCLQWQKENVDRGIKFVKLNIESIKVIVFTDSSFANNTDYSSQIGYVIVLADDKYANIVHWSSIKCRRVTRSVLASELYGLVNGVDMGSVIKTTAEKVLKQWHPEPIPLVVCTDSKSLYECLVKLGTTNEKRLMIDIMCLRQAYERREITEVVWIPGNKNPADAMTKERGKCCNSLKNLIDNNIIDITPNGWVNRE